MEKVTLLLANLLNLMKIHLLIESEFISLLQCKDMLVCGHINTRATFTHSQGALSNSLLREGKGRNNDLQTKVTVYIEQRLDVALQVQDSILL